MAVVALYIALQLGFLVTCVISPWLLSYQPSFSPGQRRFWRVFAVCFLAGLLIGPVGLYVTQPAQSLVDARREAAAGDMTVLFSLGILLNLLCIRAFLRAARQSPPRGGLRYAREWPATLLRESRYRIEQATVVSRLVQGTL